jgi:ribosomal protein S18 acetylase RimI-like enzyme
MSADLLANITFEENGHIDVCQLNGLYRIMGLDSHQKRTEHQTTAMLRVSHYYIAAHTTDAVLVGFARVCGDPYVAQVLDVITHPQYRRRGIATRCMREVIAHIRQSRYLSVTLTSDTGMAAFYHRFDFRAVNEVTLRWGGS